MKSLLTAFGKVTSQAEGQAGENLALDYLKIQGLVLLERNFRCRSGEIDLIMQHDDMLVFVEVRKRSSSHYGGAAASINRNKQSRLISAAHIYLQRYRHPPPCRFDVVAIDQDNVSWIKDAFQT